MPKETLKPPPTLQEIFDGQLSKPLVSQEINALIRARQNFFIYPERHTKLPQTVIVSEFEAGLFFPHGNPEIRSGRWNLWHKYIDRIGRERERVYSGVLIKLKPQPNARIFLFDSPQGLMPQDINNLNSLNAVGMYSDEWLVVQENEIIRKRSKRRWDI